MHKTLVQRAKEYAIAAHEGQWRDKGHKIPYIKHPSQTASIIAATIPIGAPDRSEMIAAAWLHDTIEDTDTTYEDLRRYFGEKVANLVLEVSNEKTADKRSYFPNLKTQQGVMLKFADRLSNISDMDGWNAKRQQAYINKSKFWATDAESAQLPTKDIK